MNAARSVTSKGDLMIGAIKRRAIATVFHRVSRRLWLVDYPQAHGA